MNADPCSHCREAVAKLDYLLRNHPAETADELTDAVRCSVALRDRMIERRRQGDHNPAHEQRLRQVNAVISAIVAGEFPLMGIRWQRIKGARDLLKKVLAEEEAEAAAAEHSDA
ncbi:MAG: hypothetical protein WA184_17500 [Stellaceae bacterium]|jgi:hypothetical protein